MNNACRYQISLYLYSTCTVPPPTVTIIPADNDFMYSAGNSLTLICIISLNGVLMDSATGIIVETTWTGPHGELSLASSDNGRITMSDVTKSDDFTYSSTVVFSPLHMSDTGSYSCDASVRHMLEFILPSDPGSNQVTINVKGNRSLISDCVPLFESSSYSKSERMG